MLNRDDFTWDEFFWKSQIELPEWAGYLGRSYHDRRTAGAERSDGTVDLVFAPEGREDGPLEDHELRLMQWFVDHHEEVSQVALERILASYDTLRDGYGHAEQEQAALAPDISCLDDLRPLVGLHAVDVHNVHLNGIPYIGLEFVCTWDDEHGVGLMMNGTRVVDIGGADTAILRWIAKRDAGAATS